MNLLYSWKCEFQYLIMVAEYIFMQKSCFIYLKAIQKVEIAIWVS